MMVGMVGCDMLSMVMVRMIMGIESWVLVRCMMMVLMCLLK